MKDVQWNLSPKTRRPPNTYLLRVVCMSCILFQSNTTWFTMASFGSIRRTETTFCVVQNWCAPRSQKPQTEQREHFSAHVCIKSKSLLSLAATFASTACGQSHLRTPRAPTCRHVPARATLIGDDEIPTDTSGTNCGRSLHRSDNETQTRRRRINTTCKLDLMEYCKVAQQGGIGVCFLSGTLKAQRRTSERNRMTRKANNQQPDRSIHAASRSLVLV